MKKLLLCLIVVLLLSPLCFGRYGRDRWKRTFSNPSGLFSFSMECPNRVVKGDSFIYRVIISNIREDVEELALKKVNERGVESYGFAELGDKYILEVEFNSEELYTKENLLPFDLKYKLKGKDEFEVFYLPYQLVDMKAPFSIIPKTLNIKTTVDNAFIYHCVVRMKRKERGQLKYNFPPEMKIVNKNIKKKRNDLFNIYDLRLSLKSKKSGQFNLTPVTLYTNDQSYEVEYPVSINIVPLKTKIKFKRDAVKVGQLFEAQIILQPLNGIKIDKRSLGTISLQPFELVDKSLIIKDGRVVLNITARAFLEGNKEYEFGAFPVVFKAKGETEQIRVPPNKIRINTVLSSESDGLKKIGFLDINLWRWRIMNIYLPIGLAVLVVLSIIGFLIKWKKEESSQQVQIPEGPTLSKARKKLEHLIEIIKTGEEIDWEKVYKALREYLALYNGYKRPESKTRLEIMEGLEDSKLKERIDNLLKEASRKRFDYQYSPLMKNEEVAGILEDVLNNFD